MVSTRLSWDEYATRWAKSHSGFDPRQAAPSVYRWLFAAYRVGGVLVRLRVRPTAVAVLGVLLSAGVPLVAVRPPWGALAAAGLVLLAAMTDSVRGAITVITGRATRLGYVYGALADRIDEALWLTAFWLVGAPGVLVTAGGGLSWLHEYVRARATSAGMRGTGAATVGERPTRASVTVVGLLVADLAGLLKEELRAGTVTVVAAVWVLLALFGLGQMLAAVRHALR